MNFQPFFHEGDEYFSFAKLCLAFEITRGKAEKFSQKHQFVDNSTIEWKLDTHLVWHNGIKFGAKLL